jgi:two-component system, NarL family, nitrate/nitrite response regulator NarL
MVPSDPSDTADSVLRIPGFGVSIGEALSGISQHQTAANKRMTAEKKAGKINPPQEAAAPMKVLLVAQGGLFADAFAGSLTKLASEVEVQRCEVCELKETNPPAGNLQLIVIDVDDLAGDGATAVRAARARYATAPIVALVGKIDEAHMASIMDAGAQAYLSKSYSEAQALGVLRVVVNGSSAPADSGKPAPPTVVPFLSRTSHRQQSGDHPYGLTDRELEVLTRAREGLSNLQISKRLGITEGTVKIHLSNCYDKLGVENRTQAIRKVERLDAINLLERQQAVVGSSLRDWLLPHMRDELHRQGDVLFRKGEPGRALYFLQQGSVFLPEIGKHMGEGELFGEIGIFAPGHARTCSARCETDCRLFCLTAEQANRLYFENPQFAYHVVQLIAQRLSEDKNRSH